MKTIQQVIVRFPEVELEPRDAHKLRGYFGDLFREHSPLLHNHYEDGSYRQAYPLVQYKVLDRVPTLVALNEGAELLTQLFLKVKELNINGESYSINTKEIQAKKATIGYSETMHHYKFATYWMGLNAENYRSYKNCLPKEQRVLLEKAVIGNVLGFFKHMQLMLEPNQRLFCSADLVQHQTKFKDQKMLAFSGNFSVNAQLPSYIGLGKSSSRGFGTIINID